MKYGSLFRRSRRGRLAGVVGLLLIAVAVGALVFVQGLRPEEESPVGRLAPAGTDPMAGLLEAARTRSALLIGLPVSARAGWRIAIEALDSLALGPGLDAVGVPAPADHQPAIDRYLDASVADPSLLPPDPPGSELRPLYRAVRRLNDELGVDRALRVLALWPEGWPPEAAESPSAAVEMWANRPAHALEALSAGILARKPSARLLLLVDGLDALAGVRVRAIGGGGSAQAPTTLAGLLRQRFGRNLYTVLVDGAVGGAGGSHVVGFAGTSLFDDARRLWSGAPRLAPLAGHADLGRAELRISTRAGVNAELLPASVAFSELADAYLFPGPG